MSNRILLGNLNGTMGLYISQPGQDVTTCDPAFMLFNSAVGGRMSQILATGSVVFQPNTFGTQNVPVTNNTATIPMGIFYETLQVSNGTAAAPIYQWTSYALTSNNLAVTLPQAREVNATITIFYIIFTDNSNG